MTRKIMVVLSLVLVLSLGFTTAGFADAGQGDDPEGLIVGSGKLWAKGAGYAEVHGDGMVDIAAHGVGTVRVQGAEVVRAQGQGRRWDLPDGSVLFAGWRGHIHIAGRNLDVQMLGGMIEFTAQGRGWVFLKGRGRYRANGQWGQWTTEGARVEIDMTADTK